MKTTIKILLPVLFLLSSVTDLFAQTGGTKYFAYTANFDSSSVSAFSMDKSTGTLTNLDDSPYATGLYPAAVAAAHSGEFLYSANANDDTITAFSINKSTGKLTKVSATDIATATQPYGAVVDPTDSHLYIANRYWNGVTAYSIGASGQLTRIASDTYDVFLDTNENGFLTKISG